MNKTGHKKAIIKALQSLGHGRYNVYDVFRDFIEAAAIALRASCDFAAKPRLEERYSQIMKRYDADEQKQFPMMFAELVEAMTELPGDVLGEVFGELELHNTARGQFFTPYHLCQLMAQQLIAKDVMQKEIDDKGFITLQEPAVGAGAMVIAFSEAMRDAGFNPQQQMHATCVDVDPRAVHMSYLQLALLGIPAVVVEGNTLTLEQHDVWPTPMHMLNFWHGKIRRGYALGSAMDERESN